MAAAGAWYRAGRKPPAAPALSADREAVLKATLDTVTDPGSLRFMAAAFASEGLDREAALLRKRAALKELPADVLAARRQAMRDALKSEDPAEVRTMADAFDKEGCTAVAAKLRGYAVGLETAAKAA